MRAGQIAMTITIAIIIALVIGYTAQQVFTCDGTLVRGVIGYECIEDQP